MLTRIGLASVRSPVTSSLIKPALVRGLKTIPQPPGFVVGTVNEAYVHPKPNKMHGSLHWTLERGVALGLVPLAAAPLFTGVSTVVDSTLSAFLLYHCYVGFQSCIIDYIPSRVYGSYHNYAMYLLTFGTGVAGYGIYQLEQKEGEITPALAIFQEKTNRAMHVDQLFIELVDQGWVELKLNDALKSVRVENVIALRDAYSGEELRVLHRDDVVDKDVQLATEKIRQWSKKLTTS